MPVVVKPDPFNAILLNSPVTLEATEEQRNYIKEILDIACSDSRFAEKAYNAIRHVLLGDNVVPPVVSSLNPSTAVLGSPSFDIHVHGTGFTPESVIVFAGQNEPTTYVSPTEVTTGVDMSVWVGPDALPVAVLNADGVQSDPATFTFTSAPELLAVGGTKKHPEPVVVPSGGFPVKK